MKVLKLCLLFVHLSTISSMANIINVSTDSLTIQSAIDLAKTGDTVLVHPGNYQENVNFNGKQIVVGSLFITTRLNRYIYETKISGNNSGTVITFDNGEDSTSVLSGFTISNGRNDYGAGIYILNSSPNLDNLIISQNNATRYGGGIYCFGSSPVLENLKVFENSTIFKGGGIYLNESYPIFKNVTIINNISNDQGGGIFHKKSQPVFKPEYKSTIYLNHAKYGSDLYLESSDSCIVNIDTFTVSSPTEYQVFPVDKYILNIEHPKIEQVNSDLYVSPMGNDNNSGLLKNEPLKTLYIALIKINTDSLNQRQIFLDEGTYSPKTNGEIFPVKLKSDLFLKGKVDTLTIIDADSSSSVMFCYNIKNAFIDNITLQNGSGYAGGLYCTKSEISLSNILIQNNTGVSGGGIFCYDGSKLKFVSGTIKENVCPPGVGGGVFVSHSHINFTNVDIIDNSSGQGSGIFYLYDDDSKLINVNILRNKASNTGGAIYCDNSDPYFYGVSVINNSARFVGGVKCTNNSNPKFVNSTFYQNTAEDLYYGFIDLHSNSDLFMLNSIIWNNTPSLITSSEYAARNTMTVAFSDIEGDQSAFFVRNGDTLNWLEGNISQNPLLIENDIGQVQLMQNSPCIDSGTNFFLWEEDTLINLLSSEYNSIAPDMGAIESDFASRLLDVISYSFDYKVNQNYPNPFNPETFISYQIPIKTKVELSIYNILGQKIKTLVNQKQSAGKHKIKFDASGLSSGVYFYKLTTIDFTQSKKMLVFK
ncbi:MAG: T9SS C-terminal target domain-containing protein [Calditrichaeota bacterium]|nr:MAG: T9SS C-terminal target domain-containing protein [Calditrichota bacterium]MBL1208122.1 T9SS C-terminal target domain-containing protein [Calditrichota bacterium]NOG47961.1 T9SS type A sorting domain-containing protein [Calditrichota bacterium]